MIGMLHASGRRLRLLAILVEVAHVLESLPQQIRPCASNRTKEWYKNNPEKHFFNQIKAKYGINKYDYLAMLEYQNNKCAICGDEEEQLNVWDSTKKRRLAIDHNHDTGEIRGLLCYRCNTTLGKVNEDIELLQNMILYLDGKNES